MVITASLERHEQRLDEAALKWGILGTQWGIEKVVSSATVTVGTARQRFVIDVGPSDPTRRP